jgi:hypothetical protein
VNWKSSSQKKKCTWAINTCLTSLTTKEMQSKTTLRFHLTPVRMAILKKTDNKMLVRILGERNPLTLCGENVNWGKHFGNQNGSSSRN